jgi:hypothetical protein
VSSPAQGGRAEPELIFVGGTGRSGTHAVAALIGSHPQFADVPIEARFHCNKRGMPDLLEGRITLRSYLEKLRGFWWHRVRVDGRPRGLYNLMSERAFERALGRFEGHYPQDPIEACRGLCLDLLWPVAERAGTPGLVEMSSHNVKEAQALLRVFPEARFVHALRDGRDAAASVTGKTWGPDNVVAAIGWWEERLRGIDRGVRGEEDGTPWSLGADRLHVVMLEDLVGEQRERTYRGLLGFLGVEDAPEARAHLEGVLTPEAAHRGRWRALRAPARLRAHRRYERAVASLECEGNHAAPLLRAALDREGHAGAGGGR